MKVKVSNLVLSLLIQYIHIVFQNLGRGTEQI